MPLWRPTPHKKILPIRQELKEMARCPQAEHSSKWPPCAAVRQRRIALTTFKCSQVSHFRLLSKNESPAARMMSATSRGGLDT